MNGILLGHPFTRTRRKLEDLIWRAVWIAFALAMPPIEPSVIYAHRHTYYAHLCTHSEYERGVSVCTRKPVRVYVRVYAVYTKEQFTRKRSSFVRSFARSLPRVYIRAHRERLRRYTRCTHSRVSRVYVCASARTYGFLHFMIYRAAFNGPQSVLKARRLIKEIIEDAK